MFKPFILNHNVYARPPGDRHHTSAGALGDALAAINGNTGNTYITYALGKFLDLRHELEGIANIWSEKGTGYTNPLAVNENFSHVLLVMQDQIQPGLAHLPWQKLTQWIEKIRIPIIPFSMGANGIDGDGKTLAAQLPEDMVRFLKTLADKAPSMGIRGAYTAEVLEALGITHAVAVGCPTYFEAGPKRLIEKRPFTADPAAGGNIAGTGLFVCANKDNIHYFLQDELVFLRALYGGHPEDAQKGKALLAGSYPLFSSYASHAFAHGRCHFFTSMEKWKRTLSKDFLFACGTRVHGGIIAINSGLPALCTNADKRSEEMCALFHIPRQPGHAFTGMEMQDIYESIDVGPMNAHYPALYSNFITWMQGLGLNAAYSPKNPERSWNIGELKERPRLEQMQHFIGEMF